MAAELHPLNEYGLLPVPPDIHCVALSALPGCFGAKPYRRQIWKNCLKFLEHVRTHTPIREAYLDGRFFTASDDVEHVEVGIELDADKLHLVLGHMLFDVLKALKVPSRQEFGVRVRYFAPHRPVCHNFHLEFGTPDPDIHLRDAPPDLRKGYIRVTL